ncbi:hypothetical protein LTR85_007370 [Meristemomyces frigidus]|nr:hypothetical protein LTR85_007370 [Meristemomyces frigidus]
MKTGASEIYQKLPAHFMTTFQCVPNIMIFSDLEQTFGNTKTYDAIAHVTEASRNEFKDFRLHEMIARWAQEGQDLTKLPSGWDLDKWKFLPMLHQAFQHASQEIEWFIVMEPDTSLSWSNLLLWLNTMDPQRPYYRGSQNSLGSVTFAHGGSGIVISRGAADKLVAARNSGSGSTETYDRRWEERTNAICCGDVIVAEALLEVGVAVTPSWPLTQGESINTIDWTSKHWCTPAVTWHHVTGEQVDTLWHFQSNWVKQHGWQKPYLFRELFDHFIQRHISTNKTSWNNLSNDRKYQEDDEGFHQLEQYERSAVETPDACAAACARQPETECLQWMWTAGKCHLGRDLRFGTSDEQYPTHWTSGWLQDRVDHFKRGLEGCEINWDIA